MRSESESYKAAGVDITAGYRAVELMKAHIKRTKNEGSVDDIGGFGGMFIPPLAGMKDPVLVSALFSCHHHTGYTGIRRPGQCIGIASRRQHQSDLAVGEIATGRLVKQRLQIGTAAGYEHGNAGFFF